MKKYSLIISSLLFTFFVPLIGQDFPSIPDASKLSRVMSTFLTEHDSLTGSYQSNGLLRVYPPLWEVQLDTIFNDSFPKRNYQKVLLKEAAMKWKWIERVMPYLLDGKAENTLYFEAEYLGYEKEKVYFNSQDSFKIIKVEKRLSHGRLEWVKDKFPEVKIDKNTAFKLINNAEGNPIYIKVKAGNWTEWKSPTVKSSTREMIKISQIQQALKERGYYTGELDNRTSDELHTAIIQFRRDNNISICGDTLSELAKALGIEY